ncbi:MAG: transglutaminase domain-containing protein [Candidatus Diapherotrites archaeon]|nr:transglutaminase domain-containing protein [Candidatus Diapherotrites archaeon]
MKTLLLIVILASALALELEPSDVGYAELTMRIIGNAGKEQVVYLPANDARQAVEYGSLHTEKDEYGNTLTRMSSRYSLEFRVTVDGTQPELADEPMPAARKDGEYLADSKYIIPSDEETARIARQVTTNSKTSLEAVRDLASWVHNYVEYDTKYWDGTLSSTEVLRVRKGVCDEYANLYAAMARSLSIPTRIVTGLVHTGSTWQRHGWAESLIAGTWVPVDATFGEAGTINALHVKLYVAPTYLFYLPPESEEEVEVTELDAGEYELPLTVQARLSSERVAPRGVFKVYASVKNSGDKTIMPTFLSQKTLGIELADNFRKMLVLAPGSEEIAEWSMVAPYGERDRYYVIVKGPGYAQNLEVIIDPSLEPEVFKAFSIVDIVTTAQEGRGLISVRVKNAGNAFANDVGVNLVSSAGSFQKTISLSAGEEKVVEFTLEGNGAQAFEVRVHSGDQMTTAFGSVFLPKHSEPGFGEALTQYLNDYSQIIYFTLVIIVFGAIALVLFVPSMEERKDLFRERDEWHRLLKVQEKKRS